MLQTKETQQKNNETLQINQVRVADRVRKDFGDIDELCNSITEVGLIQPIVVTRLDYRLIAGERRLRALTKLGVKDLIHAIHFIYTDEVDSLKLKAMEYEENLKRKNFTWQEEVVAKKGLLETLQKIHGIARPGAPTHQEIIGVVSKGFGINKLANLLGESNAKTSQDIELAALLQAVPQLAQAETKEAARRTAQLATTLAVCAAQQKANPPKVQSVQNWTLYEGDFVKNASNIETESIDLVITDPPYGNDSQGMGPNSKTLLASSFKDDKQTVVSIINDLAYASYRVLRPNTFACFFFDFVIYSDLVSHLTAVGFSVDLTPLIWIKNNVINTAPYIRYSRSYEPILVARKGQPRLFRPSQRDVLSFDTITVRSGDASTQKYYHAQKPVALIEKLILDLSPPGSTIVDFCAGSGTTGEASLINKRKTILFEKDETACKIIKARLGALK
jgi:DNA modification methylase